MNDTIRQLYERRSVRVFQDREIPQDTVNTILMSAVMAPTAGNQQLYTILNITDPQLKARLAITCDDQPFIAEAKLVLIFCADCTKWHDAFRYGGCEPRAQGVGDLMLAVSDANIAAQNAVVAAESLGIGSCYIGDVMENCEQHRELLRLPDHVFPAAMLVFGYPTEGQKRRKKPERSKLEHIVHENGYRRMDKEELEKMLSCKSGEMDHDRWITAFCERKYNSDFSREMTRSVGEYIKSFMPRD